MSFSTYDIKEQWRKVFCCGNPESKEVILILGSCRAVPYLNYLDHYNQTHGNRFKIFCIDPINMQVDMAGNALDTKALLTALEADKHFLDILKSVTIFIHEGLSSFGILNTVREPCSKSMGSSRACELGTKACEVYHSEEKNIYGHGMAPEIDINVPNFHDCIILVNDFAQLYPTAFATMLQIENYILYEGNTHIARFCSICEKSSFPEFGPWFRENYLKVRLFHSFNHVSAAFTREIFRLANEKFLHLDLDDAFWQHPDVTHDMYANVSTKLTDLDRKWRTYEWVD